MNSEGMKNICTRICTNYMYMRNIRKLNNLIIICTLYRVNQKCCTSPLRNTTLLLIGGILNDHNSYYVSVNIYTHYMYVPLKRYVLCIECPESVKCSACMYWPIPQST